MLWFCSEPFEMSRLCVAIGNFIWNNQILQLYLIFMSSSRHCHLLWSLIYSAQITFFFIPDGCSISVTADIMELYDSFYHKLCIFYIALLFISLFLINKYFTLRFFLIVSYKYFRSGNYGLEGRINILKSNEIETI